MSNTEFQNAARAAHTFLLAVAPDKTTRFAAPGAEILQPDRTIRQALSEAQLALNRTSTGSIRKRIAALKAVRKKQLWINIAHFATGSALASLVANWHPDLIKWGAAIIAFSAGAVGLTLPKSVAGIEQQVLDDTDAVSSLSGQVAQLQTQLLLKNPETDEKLATEIASIIGRCMELAKKYELDFLTAESELYRGGKIEPRTP